MSRAANEFFSRFPQASKLGLVLDHYDPKFSRMAFDDRSGLSKLTRYRDRLRSCAMDAVRLIDGPMQEEPSNTPEKVTARHAIQANQHADVGNVEQVLAHLKAAIHAAQQSPEGEELVHQLSTLYEQLIGGNEPAEGSQDGDEFSKRY